MGLQSVAELKDMPVVIEALKNGNVVISGDDKHFKITALDHHNEVRTLVDTTVAVKNGKPEYQGKIEVAVLNDLVDPSLVRTVPGDQCPLSQAQMQAVIAIANKLGREHGTMLSLDIDSSAAGRPEDNAPVSIPRTQIANDIARAIDSCNR